MCRVVRTPAVARRIFTPNEICGWPDGIQYEPRQLRKAARERRREQADATVLPPPPTVPVICGIKLV